MLITYVIRYGNTKLSLEYYFYTYFLFTIYCETAKIDLQIFYSIHTFKIVPISVFERKST